MTDMVCIIEVDVGNRRMLAREPAIAHVMVSDDSENEKITAVPTKSG